MRGVPEITRAQTTPVISWLALFGLVRENRRVALPNAFGRRLAGNQRGVSVFTPPPTTLSFWACSIMLISAVRSCLSWWSWFHLLRTYVLGILVESFGCRKWNFMCLYAGSVRIVSGKNLLKVKRGENFVQFSIQNITVVMVFVFVFTRNMASIFLTAITTYFDIYISHSSKWWVKKPTGSNAGKCWFGLV